MSAGSVAEKYASVLLETAQQEQAEDEVAEDLQWLVSLLGDSETFRLVWLHPVLQLETKTEVLRPALADELSPLSWRFVRLLMDKRREQMLVDIQRELMRQLRQQRGQQSVQVRTAMDIPEDVLDRLQRVLSDYLGAEAVLQQRHDPQLIAGLVLNIEDKKIDASLRRRLQEVRRSLTEEASDGRQ